VLQPEDQVAVGQLHTHQIQVETEEEFVTVQIGGEGSVPGGFAKFFNRVIDSEAWARLSDAGRAAYLPLVRFADNRNQYRVQIGQAALMKYAGLSRSSIKRALKDLLTSRLIVLVEQGGVTPDGRNESNLYQLMIPVDPKPRMTGGPSYTAAGETRGGPLANPLQGQSRTPSVAAEEPPRRPLANPDSALHRTATPTRWTPLGGAAGGPQLRNISEPQDNSRSVSPPQPVVSQPIEEPADAAVLLEKHGVERLVARQLAGAYPLQRVVDVVETMQFRRSRGKCENPGGFIRDALVKQWQTPQSVIDARAKAETRARAEAAIERTRRAETTQVAAVDADQRRVEQLIDALDDDELELLAHEVLKKYDGNSAVLSVLTRKPARECRLMKMEIAAMLGRR
jgi:hypothetical protein